MEGAGTNTSLVLLSKEYRFESCPSPNMLIANFVLCVEHLKDE